MPAFFNSAPCLQTLATQSFFSFFFVCETRFCVDVIQVSGWLLLELNMKHQSVVKDDDSGELIPKKEPSLRYLGFKTLDVNQTTILCKCCWTIAVAAGSNASNLLHHFSRTHVLEYQECIKLSLLGIHYHWNLPRCLVGCSVHVWENSSCCILQNNASCTFDMYLATTM